MARLARFGIPGIAHHVTHRSQGSLGIDVHGTGKDVSWSYTRNPASQILTETQSTDRYSWDGHVSLARNYTTNGLNQYTGAGSASFCYDANGCSAT